jgi:hypothetical protein
MKINKNNQVYNNFKEEVIKDIKEENKYNGWTNYPTWCFKLWLDNDQYLHNNIYDRIKENINKRFIISIAIETLQIVASEMTEDQYTRKDGGTFTNDLIGYALNQINYNEVATAIIEDIKQELN